MMYDIFKLSKGFSFFYLAALIYAVPMQSQERPPIPIEVEVNTSQFLNFGAFTIGSGKGTVSVDHQGTRSFSGDVYLLNFGQTVSPALFDVKANPGTILSILTQRDIYLRGDNGGRIRLELDSFSPDEMFISTAQPPHVNSLYVGGTLFLENASANPPGNYSGTFSITVVHQ